MIYLVSDLSDGTIQRDVCLTEACVRSAANILQQIDKTVDPCEDFYKFACGNYIKNTNIPEHEVGVSPFDTISDKVEHQLTSLLGAPILDSDPKFSKLVKTIYSSCMNVSKIEQEGLSYVKKEFKGFGGWPVIEPYWNETSFDWISLQCRLKKDGWGSNFFFEMSVATDLKVSTRTIVTLDRLEIVGGEQLTDGFNATIVRARYDYFIELAVLFGADRATAIGDMKDVIDFEIDMANLDNSNEETQDTYYKLATIRDLQMTFKSLPWLKLINNYLFPLEMFTYNQVVNVVSWKFFEKFDQFWPKVKKRTLSNFMFLIAVIHAADYLPKAFKRKEQDFVKIVYGRNELRPRSRECVRSSEILNVAVSSLYIKHFFAEDTRLRVIDLAKDIQSVLSDKLHKADWMDQKTKRHAVRKLQNMDLLVGYPEEIMDDHIIENYYKELELDTDDYYLKIHLNISKFSNMKHVQALRNIDNTWKSVARTYDVMAIYNPSINTIELFAAILQDQFYDPDRPQYLNYGAIGQVIGHEMTHGFDAAGREFDKDGNLIDWWKPETSRTFLERSLCFVEQYGNCTVPEIGINLDGVNTLGESIADNGGIKIAYGGYFKWLEKNKPEPLLPGLSYNARQLFWISAASIWCANLKSKTLKELVISGEHTPDRFRVVVPFMNSGYFGEDFNCPVGSPMNPENKCSVW